MSRGSYSFESEVELHYLLSIKVAIEGHVFSANLIILEMPGYNVILSMN